MEIAALCLSIKFKQDLHSPQKLIIFAVGKVTTRFPFFMPCGKTQCNLRQITVQLDANYTIT